MNEEQFWDAFWLDAEVMVPSCEHCPFESECQLDAKEGDICGQFLREKYHKFIGKE